MAQPNESGESEVIDVKSLTVGKTMTVRLHGIVCTAQAMEVARGRVLLKLVASGVPMDLEEVEIAKGA